MREYPINAVIAPQSATIGTCPACVAEARAMGTGADAYATPIAGNQSRTNHQGVLLSVIVPVYNEAATIDQLLRRVVEVPLDMQVIVVDDGSTDGTTTILERWEGHPLVELLAHARNRGKGAAIRTGLEHARGRYTIVQDADLEYDPADYARLLAPLVSGEADAVYGSRYMKPSADGPNSKRPPWSLFRVGVCALNVAAGRLYGARLSDEATCYKLFATETLRAMRLECERFEFCPEVTAKACRMGLTICEIHVRYLPRGMADGKKIRWRDGVKALKTLWRYRNWNCCTWGRDCWQE